MLWGIVWSIKSAILNHVARELSGGSQVTYWYPENCPEDHGLHSVHYCGTQRIGFIAIPCRLSGKLSTESQYLIAIHSLLRRELYPEDPGLAYCGT